MKPVACTLCPWLTVPADFYYKIKINERTTNLTPCPCSEKQSNAIQYTWQVILSLFYHPGCKKRNLYPIHVIVSVYVPCPVSSFCSFLWGLNRGAGQFPFQMTTGEASGQVLVCQVILEKLYLQFSMLRPTLSYHHFPRK